jgi:uncharacterized protein with ParB-like and HNH nuclease domain
MALKVSLCIKTLDHLHLMPKLASMIRSAQLTSIGSLLGDNRKLEIPPFQRDYKWSEKEVKALINDVCSEIDWCADNFKPYYLGAIVTCPKDNNTHVDVLDGQQRLTTLSILLRVLVRIVKFDYQSSEETNVSSLLYSGSRKESREPKLLLHDPNEKDGDHHVFRDILFTDSKKLNLEEANNKRRGRKGSSAAMRTNLYKAFKCAETTVLEIIESKSHNQEDKVHNALLIAEALKSATIIHILTNSESDAFVLFETLNERGLALSAADLIKNKLLQNSKKDSILTTANKWKKMVKNCSSRGGSSKTVDFLRAWWNAEKGFVRKPELYEKYADLIGRPSERGVRFDIKVLCDELVNASEFYSLILEPRNIDRSAGLPGHHLEKIRRHLNFMRSMGFISVRPLILSTLLHRPELTLKVIELAEIIAVRNLGGNTNSLERAYSNACEFIRNNKFDDSAAYESVAKIFLDGDLVPNENKFLESIKDYEFNEENARAILMRVDQQIRKIDRDNRSTAYDSKPASELHLEHILPIKPSKEAIDEFLAKGEYDDDGESGERVNVEKYIWKLGNLTLLESGDNQSLSNSAYSTKSARYLKSEYALTKRIPREFDYWSPKIILNRTVNLSKIMEQIWPIPQLRG